MNQIMQACHWKTHNTFIHFYLKDLTWSDNDNNMYLGPVVVAQQVLDPSLRPVILGNKRKGGHIRYNEVFRSLIPGSRCMFTSSGCLGKVFYFSIYLLYYVLRTFKVVINLILGWQL